MDLLPIITTNAIGLVLLASLLFTSHMMRERRRVDDRMFTFMILICGGACIMEALTWAANGRPGTLARMVNLLGNTYCYLATTTYGYLWCLYVDLRLNRRATTVRRLFPGLLVPTALIAVLILVNLFVPIMFIIDEANVYHRLPLSYINYVMTFISLFYGCYIKRCYQREQGKMLFFPVWIFLTPVFVGAAAQAALFGISTAWCSVSVGLTAIYMSQQNELAYLDALTGVYNRTFFDYAIVNLTHATRGGSSGIMIDLDFFKEINDTYGHSAGDDALRHIASILLASVPDDAHVVRFAGDEFIVLLKGDDVKEIEALKQAIRQKVVGFNASHVVPYELSLSMGHAIYSKEQDTADSYLRRMDAQMYEEKRAKHAER